MTMPDKTQPAPPVILLAAGLGTRMAPLTDTQPKPLIEVGGVPLLDRTIANCQAEGCSQFVINGHHHIEQMQSHVAGLKTKFPTAEFQFSPEPTQLLDTGGGAKQALGKTAGDPVLVSNSDAFWHGANDQPITRMQSLFAEKSGVVLLCAHPMLATGFRRSHDFCLAPDGAVTNDRGVPVIYAGVALVHRCVFDDTPDGPFSFADILFRAQDENSLWGVRLDAHWLHVGDPPAIGEAEAILQRSHP